MKKITIFSVLLIILITGWSLFAVQYFEKESTEFHGKQYYKIAPQFSLTDHNGKEVNLSDYKNKLVLLSWGFTNCPDICPLTLSTLKKVMSNLGEHAENVQVLFITVDPERDIPERLKSYVPNFHESFIGLTGSREEIDKVVENYGAFYFIHSDAYGRSERDTWESYQLTHTTNISLIDGRGRMIVYYPYNKWDADGISRDINTLLNEN
ncbi:MAG: SCO family protein [Thermodesulfobacteriota bacterium]